MIGIPLLILFAHRKLRVQQSVNQRLGRRAKATAPTLDACVSDKCQGSCSSDLADEEAREECCQENPEYEECELGDEAAFGLCFAKEQGVEEGLGQYRAFGTCCARFPAAEACSGLTKACASADPSKEAAFDGVPKAAVDAFCSAFFAAQPDVAQPDVAPSPTSTGLGAGAIAGIVVGSVAVVGGVSSVLVYFLVCKEAAVVATAA
jgi:hypothetical protein